MIKIKDSILFAAGHCLDATNDPEDEILYGTAGFLYVINLVQMELGKTMEKVQTLIDHEVDTNTDFFDFKVKLSDLQLDLADIIQDIVKVLINQTQESQTVEGNKTIKIVSVKFPRYRRAG